jgi:NADPH2:quinone reductase
MRAIQIDHFGGPETLTVREVPDPQPGEGEQLFDVLAAGVNYADTHQTENTYLAEQTLPMVPGSEVVVRAPDGRRLTGLLGTGGYAEKAAANPGRLFTVPDEVSDAQALTTLVQGATAWHLLRTSTHMREGETVVVHAGAGGVGTLAIQLARRWGAGRIIATASSVPKRQLCLDLGADVAVDSRAEELTDELREANGGTGVDVVLEMTGGSVFDASLAALAPLGRLATFGMASRTPPSPITPGDLMAHGRAVIGFWLVHVVAHPALFGAAVTDLMTQVAAGSIKPVIGGTYPLDRAAEAHLALRGRDSVGKLVLDPTA